MSQDDQTIKVLLLSENAKLPVKGSKHSAGHDLFCIETFDLPPGKFKLINTGISIEIPDEHYGRIAPRSGLALSHGIQVLGGVVDSDYRGEIKVILYNVSEINKTFLKHDKIAQIIIEKISTAEFILADQLSRTSRDAGGFGSTGN